MKYKLFLALGLLGFACFEVTRADDPTVPGPNTYLRVLHAAPDGPKVDYMVDGHKKLNDMEFGSLSKYQRFPAGYRRFAIDSNNPSETLLSGGRTLRKGQFSTLVLFKTRSGLSGTLYDDSSGWVAPGRARLTVYNLSPGLPLDVTVTTGNGNTYTLFRKLRYGQARSTQVVAVPMTVKLRAGGSTLKTIDGVEPRQGRMYAGYIMGRVGKDFKVLLDPTASQ